MTVAFSVGIGFDAHRFAEGRALMLGTVAVDHPLGLAGHSDGDVLAHAIVDSVLGAAGAGDIGALFPSDDTWRDAASIRFLNEAAVLVRAEGFEIVSVDATVVCERPRIDPYRSKMAAALASALDIPKVGVKATTTDTMGFTGRGEGIAAIAVALLER